MTKKNNTQEQVIKAPDEVPFVESFSVYITKRVGSVTSVLIHTVFFVGIFALSLVGFTVDQIMLILTTVVSLEAIYLAIFIQMTINRHERDLSEVHEQVEDIQEDIEEIQEDIEEIGEDVEEMSEDIEEISEDVGEISEDVEEINEEMKEEDDHASNGVHESEMHRRLHAIETTLEAVLQEVKRMEKTDEGK